MGKCVKCKQKEGKLPLISKEKVCKECFCLIIEKRLLSCLRNKHIILSDVKNVFIVDDSPKSLFLKLFANQFDNQMVFDIEIKKHKVSDQIFEDKTIIEYAKKNKARVFIPWLADDEAEFLLRSLTASKNPKYLSCVVKNKGVTFVKPLINISHSEALTYIEIKTGKKFKQLNQSKIRKMIDAMEEKYPGRVFGLVKSAEMLSKL